MAEWGPGEIVRAGRARAVRTSPTNYCNKWDELFHFSIRLAYIQTILHTDLVLTQVEVFLNEAPPHNSCLLQPS